jgi:hypothetical protein
MATGWHGMGRKRNDLSWEIVYFANAPQDPEDPRRLPPPPPSRLGAVLGGALFGVFGVVLAVRSGNPASLILLVFTYAMVAQAFPRRKVRGTGSQRRSGAAPLPEWARRRARHDVTDPRRRFRALQAEYAAFECDPLQVLRLPALTDVSVPSTARFVDAFAEAQALYTDDPAPGPHTAKFIAAVDEAVRAWEAARDAARRIRFSRLSPDERRTVERVVKILTVARDSDSEPERLAAYARARAELHKLDRAGTVHVPGPTIAAVDAALPRELPAPDKGPRE